MIKYLYYEQQSEGIPATYFSWVEPDGRIIYHTVAYDGRGDAYTYE